MKLIPLILILSTFISPLRAQISLDIVNDRQSGFDKPGFGNAGFDDSLSVEIYLRGLILSLHDQAYLEASVDSVVYGPEKARAYLHTGKRYNHVRVSLGLVDQQILRSLNIRTARYEQRILDISVFRALQHKLLGHYENSGYPFASAALLNMEMSGDTISGSLAIKENTRYLIDSIYIYGDPPVKRDHLYRHIGIHPGDPYSEHRFTRAGELLSESSFITVIRQPEMEFMQNTADLYLYLDHRQASRFSGILGIMPGGEGARARLAGELSLDLINSFRRMETIRLNWQSPGNQVQQMDLELAQPWLFGRAFGADLHLHMYRQDTTYMTVQAEGGILFSQSGGRMLRVFGKTYGTSLMGGERENVTVTPAAGVTGRIFGVSYHHSRLSNRINPYRGREINISAGAGNKRVVLPAGYPTGGDERRTGLGEGTAQLRWFVPVTPSTTLMFSGLSGIRLNIGSEKGQDYFFSNELFLLGGLHTIRGFDERSLGASAYAIHRLEYRYLFDESGNIFLFFDGMAYRQQLRERVISDLPFGFGGGLSFDTRAGQFSISYALGRQLGNPVSFRTAKVHVGIINRF